MAKITKASGPTFSDCELQDPAPPSTVQEHLPENPNREINVTRAMIGETKEGDESSPGSNSSQFSETDISLGNPPNQDPPEPAQTTVSRSVPLELTDSSDVHSTDGNGLETETESDEEEYPYDSWHKEDLQEELRRRTLPVSGTKPELVARLVQDDDEAE